MDLPDVKPMTIEEEAEKTKRLYPQLLPDKTCTLHTVSSSQYLSGARGTE